MANPEVLTWSPDELIKIHSFEEFQREVNIQWIKDSELLQYFEWDKPLETTKGELMELRRKYLEWQPNVESIKTFLIEKKQGILSDAKKWVEWLKKVTWDLEQYAVIEKKKLEEWKLEWQKADIYLKDKLEWGLEEVKKIWWETLQNAPQDVKNLWDKAKNAIEKWAEAVKEVWFVELLKNMKEELGFLGFFAWILLFLVNLAWFGNKEEKLKEAKDAVKEKLSPESIAKTKEEIKNVILRNFPGKEAYVKSIIDNPKVLTEEKIRNLYEKIKDGKWLTLADLKEEFKDLDIEKFVKEKRDEALKILYTKIQEEIEKKYNKKLDEWQIIKLRELISNRLKINEWNIEELEKRVIKDNQIQVKDVTPILSDIWASTVSFILWLVTENIISASDIALEVADKWLDVVKLSVWALWLWKLINIDDIYKDFEWLWDTEKAVLIWLLYRKGGIFLSLCWNITSWVSRLTLETLLPTNSWVDWFKILKDWFSADANMKQVENFEKIEKALAWTSEIQEWTSIIKEVQKNVIDIKKNFITIELVEKSNGDVNKFYQLVSELESSTNIKLEIPKFNTFEELRSWLADNMSKSYATKHSFDSRDLKNKYLWFWLENAIQDMNKQIESIAKNQARIVLWKINFAPLKKLTDVIDLSKVSRLWDRLLFELRSKDDTKAFIKQINELAKQSPDLIKWIFDKLPIIAVWWLAATWDEPFLENLQKEMPYLLPIAWPVLMIADSWVEWSGFNPKFIKPEQTLVAWALLTLDWYFLLNEKWLVNKWKYLVKPIKDIYEIWKWTVEVWQKLYRWWSVLNKELIVKAVEKTKAVKWKARLFAIIWMIWYWAFEVAFGEDSKLQSYFKDWKLDREKIKQESKELTNEERSEIVKMAFLEELWEETVKWLEFKMNSDKSLEITSNNEKIKSDWVINNDIKENLNELLWIDKFDFIYKQKTA